MPEVTVIVPVYNVERYLSRCIDSILKQSYQDFELICINDCSPDGSQKILDQYAKQYPDQIRVLVNEENRGLGKTRERGISHAKGRYLMFIDSDDYIKDTYIETYIRAMKREQCDMVIGGYIRDVDGKMKEHRILDSEWSMLTYPIACAKMFRKDFLLENKLAFSEIRSGEDIFFSLCVFSCNASYYVLDYAGYFYYFNRKSITGTINHQKDFEQFVSQIFDEFLHWRDIHALDERMYRMIEYTYIANMVNALVTYGHGKKIKRMRKKYQFFLDDVREKFPSYQKNPYYGFFKPKGQTAKIRFGVGVVMSLHKIHLDWMLFYLISLF